MQIEEHNDPFMQYEMSVLQGESNLQGTPHALSAQSSRAPLHANDPQEGTTIQELPPVDRGFKAWAFCLSGFVLEMMVWGFGFRSVLDSSHFELIPMLTGSISTVTVYSKVC